MAHRSRQLSGPNAVESRPRTEASSRMETRWNFDLNKLSCSQRPHETRLSAPFPEYRWGGANSGAPRKFLSLRSWWRDPLRMIEDLKRGAARNADQGDPPRLEREIEMPLPEAASPSGCHSPRSPKSALCRRHIHPPAARGVLLDHEPTPLGAGAISARLRCNGKLALAAINLKSQDLKSSTRVAMP
jgi:hypothetical protein